MATVTTKRKARVKLSDGDVRLRLLRVLLGAKNPHAAARMVDLEEFGGEVWTNIESPSRKRQLWSDEARDLAEIVGVPESFFTAPINRLGDVGPAAAAPPVDLEALRARAAKPTATEDPEALADAMGDEIERPNEPLPPAEHTEVPQPRRRRGA